MATKSRKYIFTCNNYDDSQISEIQKFCESLKKDGSTKVIYCIYGKEVAPTTGTPHLQGFIMLRDQMTMSALNKKCFLNRASFKVARGTVSQNVKYCGKEDNVTEYGDRAAAEVAQGARSDLETICTQIKEGATLKRIAEEHPSQFVRYHRGFAALRTQLSVKRDWKTYVLWAHGPTGVGKSGFAHAYATHLHEARGWTTYVKNPDTGKWWDGYETQEIIIIDDWRPSMCTFASMLRMLDRYEHRVETKGGMAQFAPKIIIITTPKDAAASWSNITEERMDQLLRRINESWTSTEAIENCSTFCSKVSQVIMNWDTNLRAFLSGD
ncbi:hypothetical protein [uncultured marine virus]|uniref:ATP-dependent helicase Rep n=1 Tax=uncultured marine virus TaxID=186617 RepID=S4TF57_9VIRU|nr:hypothetical protein [uncultured marine virus]